MSSESHLFPPRAAIMQKFWHTVAVGSATTVGTVALGLLAGAIQGWPGLLAGLAALALLVVSHIRWSDAAEHLAKAKGIYHPMHGILGPTGLVMVVFTRSAPDLTGAKPTRL
jgi:hypothetical protein